MIAITALSEKEIDNVSGELFSETFRTHRHGTDAHAIGDAARLLGIPRFVSQAEFQNLARNVAPALAIEPNETNRVAAWRIDMSGTKSLSALWAVAPKKTSVTIESVFLTAVVESLRCLDRPTIGKWALSGQFLANSPVMILFACGTAWDQSPHLNASVFLFNIAFSNDLSFASFNSAEIIGQEAKLKWFYEGALDHFLSKAIGPFQRAQHSEELRIEGVPQELVRKFFFDSSAAFNANDTKSRSKMLTNGELFLKWQEQGDSLGWGRKEAAALISGLDRERLLNDIATTCSTALYKGANAVEHFWHRIATIADAAKRAEKTIIPEHEKDYPTHSR